MTGGQLTWMICWCISGPPYLLVCNYDLEACKLCVVSIKSVLQGILIFVTRFLNLVAVWSVVQLIKYSSPLGANVQFLFVENKITFYLLYILTRPSYIFMQDIMLCKFGRSKDEVEVSSCKKSLLRISYAFYICLNSVFHRIHCIQPHCIQNVWNPLFNQYIHFFLQFCLWLYVSLANECKYRMVKHILTWIG